MQHLVQFSAVFLRRESRFLVSYGNAIRMSNRLATHGWMWHA